MERNGTEEEFLWLIDNWDFVLLLVWFLSCLFVSCIYQAHDT